MMNQRRNEDEMVLTEQRKPPNAPMTIAVFVVFVWMLLGVVAFITSLICFAYNGGSFMQNWVGFITALVLGPFYWIYYTYAGTSYCTSAKKQQTVLPLKRKLGKKPKRA